MRRAVILVQVATGTAALAAGWPTAAEALGGFVAVSALIFRVRPALAGRIVDR